MKPPARHRALPDWIVTGKEPVPLSPAFRTQAMSTQVYAFIMSLIDGKRSIQDMAVVLEKQQLMTRVEAEAGDPLIHDQDVRRRAKSVAVLALEVLELVLDLAPFVGVGVAGRASR